MGVPTQMKGKRAMRVEDLFGPDCRKLAFRALFDMLDQKRASRIRREVDEGMVTTKEELENLIIAEVGAQEMEKEARHALIDFVYGKGEEL